MAQSTLVDMHSITQNSSKIVFFLVFKIFKIFKVFKFFKFLNFLLCTVLCYDICSGLRC